MSPGLLLAKKMNGSVTSKLSVPVVVNVPLTVKSPTQTMLPPMFKLAATPRPPAIVTAPVDTLPLCVESSTRTIPPVYMLPVRPSPPSMVMAPDVVVVEFSVALNWAVLTPATVTVIEVALPQKIPVLLADKL